MTNKSYIIYQLNKMADNLGRVPTQEEFTTIVPRYYIREEFGTYNELLTSAGLEPNKTGVGRKKKGQAE